jgi:hypothetical protein
MIDMAQAERGLRSTSRPMPYTWHDIKTKAHIQRGEICVIRCMSGSPEMLRLDEQRHYKEWIGCFSYIGEVK